MTGKVLPFAAKWFGLAAVVLIVATLAEWLSASPLTRETFRSGVGYAYLSAIGVVIAFPNPAPSVGDEVRRTVTFCLVGLVIWVGLGLPIVSFETVSALTGIGYLTVVRRWDTPAPERE